MTVNDRGLSSKEARRLLQEHGKNELLSKGGKNGLKIFANQFKDLMTLILIACTGVSLLMGEVTEAVAIVVIVVLNAGLGFVQEYRTEKTLEALKNLSAPTAIAIRDGKETEVDTTELVPGDIIKLRAGGRIPADCTVLECYALACDEAIITGESVPVEKSAESRSLMGSNVTKGHGFAMVTQTGMKTEMGKIAGMLGEIEEAQTPLQIRLEQLGKYIGVGCLLICTIVSLTGIMRGEKLIDMLITGISLAVAAVPEGLPAIVTISLALAVRRILARNALVKDLYAVETLGCAGVICTDKTGTLTENKMTVQKLWSTGGELSVTGDGYSAIGAIFKSGRQMMKLGQQETILLKACCYCNNAEIHIGDNKLFAGVQKYEGAGEPTELALLIAAAKAGITREGLEGSVADEIPFDSIRKMMSVRVEELGEQIMYTKGAVDYLLKKCTAIAENGKLRTMTAADRQSVNDMCNSWAGESMRVLGFAYKDLKGGNFGENNLVFAGLVAMIDPPRKEAREAVRRCTGAHMRTIMITGDHKLTAVSVAKELGILRQNGIVVTGEELDGLTAEQLRRDVSKIDVYARATPEHKLRIVRALKAAGEIVAMTGDGVNDAPALKEADIGVAMGIAGSDVAKEAANIILLDDNFATLVAAVEEGRTIYANIRRSIRYLLSCNIGEVVTMFFGMLMGMPVILTPIQILLINLVTDGLPAVALGFEPGEQDNMQKKPRASDESIFAGGLLGTIIFRGFIIGLCTLGAFSVLFGRSNSLEVARTGALLTLIFTQLIHVFECKSESHSILRINPFSNTKLLFSVLVSGAVAMAAVYFPPARVIMQTAIPTPSQWGVVAFFCLLGPSLWAVVLEGAQVKKSRNISHPN